MKNLITVATFQFPHEAHVIKSKLESMGIPVLLQDELTVQAYGFISNALGGVKLQIQESDVSTALPILKEAGLLEEDKEEISNYLLWIDKQTKQIPLIKNWPLEIRNILVVLVVLIFIFAMLILYNLTSEEGGLLAEKRAGKIELKSDLRIDHSAWNDNHNLTVDSGSTKTDSFKFVVQAFKPKT